VIVRTMSGPVSSLVRCLFQARLFGFAVAIAVAACSTCRAEVHPKPVLIYYANETHYVGRSKDNFERLIGVLQSDTKGRGRAIVGTLRKEAKLFSESVRAELDRIIAWAEQTPGARLVAFTNELSSQGVALLFDGEEKRARRTPFPRASADNFIAASQPNTTPETFGAALALAAGLFRAEQHVFSLVAKSHADKNFILIPRVTLPLDEVIEAKVLDLANARIVPTGIPPWMQELGTTGREFMQAIKKAGQTSGMKFELVYAETCDGRATIDNWTLPDNVRTLVVPSVDVPFKNLDYGKVLAKAVDPAPALIKQLRAKFPGDVARRSEGVELAWNVALWWLPLAFFVAGIIVARKTSRFRLAG
jgi:hypothetical protein